MKNMHDNETGATRFAVKMVIASLFVAFLTSAAFAQSQTIRGVVKSDDNEPVPGANIYLKHLSAVGTFSDTKGEFVFPRPLKSGDVLVFSFLGMTTTEYVVPDKSVDSISITMPLDSTLMVDEILVETDEQSSFVVTTKRARKTKTNR